MAGADFNRFRPLTVINWLVYRNILPAFELLPYYQVRHGRFLLGHDAEFFRETVVVGGRQTDASKTQLLGLASGYRSSLL
jgi:hypothetical protein